MVASTCKKRKEQGSELGVSENPTICPRLLIPPAWPLLPPSKGSGVITPFCQTNGRHIDGFMKPQTSSPLGSGVEVFELPETVPLSLTAEPPLSAPRLPRLVITPFCQRNASASRSPVRVETPVTEP